MPIMYRNLPGTLFQAQGSGLCGRTQVTFIFRYSSKLRGFLQPSVGVPRRADPVAGPSRCRYSVEAMSGNTDRQSMLAVVRADIEDCKTRIKLVRTEMVEAEADLAAAERYARYLEAILDERERDDDALVERIKTQRTIEDGIALIASESPDRTVTSERANRLIGQAGIGTPGAVYGVLSRTKSFNKVGRAVYRLKPDWEEKRRQRPVRTVMDERGADGGPEQADGERPAGSTPATAPPVQGSTAGERGSEGRRAG